MSKDNMSDQKVEYYSLNAKLCRLVQENPCMYDRSSPNYLKKEYVDRAWANIAREVNDSVGSCKERWRNIRTAYARSVNIYKTPSGPNRHKRYYLHDELQFLTKHITPGLPSLPIRVLTPTELEDNLNSRQSLEESDDQCTFQITIDSSSPPASIQNGEDREERQPTPQPDYIETPLKKRRNDFEHEDNTRNVSNDMEFLKSILPEMGAMNARQKILFKGKIFQALEEVFNDTKDFPQKIQITNVTNDQTMDSPNFFNNTRNRHSAVSTTNGLNTYSKEKSNQVLHTTLTPTTTVKQEPFSVQID